MAEGRLNFTQFMAWLLENLFAGEGATDSKLVNADYINGNFNSLFQRDFFTFASGKVALDNGGTTADQLDVTLQTSISGTLGYSKGLVQAGQVVIAYYITVGMAWVTTAYADNKVLLNDGCSYAPDVTPALDYRDLKVNDALQFACLPASVAMPLPEAFIAKGIKALNLASLVCEADGPTNPDTAAPLYIAGSNAETNLYDVVQALLHEHTAVGDHRDYSILAKYLAPTALQEVRRNILPNSHFTYFASYDAAAVYLPMLWRPGGSPPILSNQYATDLAGSETNWQLGLNSGQSVITNAFAPNQALLNRLLGRRVDYFVLAKAGPGHNGDPITASIFDNVDHDSADMVLTSDFQWFPVYRTINGAATGAYLELRNGTAGAGAQAVIAEMAMVVTVTPADSWYPLVDWHRMVYVGPFSTAGNITANTYLNHAGWITTATDCPSVIGTILGCYYWVDYGGTAPSGATAATWRLVFNGGVLGTNQISVVSGESFGQASYTPASPPVITLGGVSREGAKLAITSRVVGSTNPGNNARGHILVCMAA